MSYHVRTTPRAQVDIDSVLHWMIHERKSLQGAKACLDAYEQAIAALAEQPERFPNVSERAELGRDVRQFLFKTRHGRSYRGVFLILDAIGKTMN